MPQSLTLLELNSLVRRSLENAFPDLLWLQAEIHELRVSGAGHCNLELIQKDERSDQVLSKVRANIWASRYPFIRNAFESQTGQALTSGIKVLVKVKVTYHEVYGLSLNVQDIDPSYTLGDLQKVRLRILRQLEQEGVLDMNKELVMPLLPQRIAVISSSTAAGFGDFMNQLENNARGFRFKVELFQATMQGKDVEPTILAALEAIMGRLDEFDCVVIIRGGGAKSDLLGFDTYNLAAACCNFPLPIITGIGHERDNTVLDEISNVRVKTPTAAAEYLISRFEEAWNRLSQLREKLLVASQTLLSGQKDTLRELKLKMPSRILARLKQEREGLARVRAGLPGLSIRYVQRKRGKVDMLRQHLALASRGLVKQQGHKLELLGRHLYDVSPERILEKGYSVTLSSGKLVRSAQNLASGTDLVIVLHDGRIEAVSK